MAIRGLLDHVRSELRTKPSIIMDAAALREKIGIIDMPVTRRNCNHLANLVSQSGASPLSTVELFQRADNGETLVFMIFARSRPDHTAAMTELQSMVISDAQVVTGEKAEIKPHIMILHPHPERVAKP